MAQKPVKAPKKAKAPKAIAVPSPEQENAPQPSAETPAPAATPEEKPDLSRMDDENKMSSLVNILKQFPPQYLTDELVKSTVWSVARFTPSDEMLAAAREKIDNPGQRFPN